MSWRPIARKDFRDSVRSKTLWLLVSVFVLVLLIIAYAARQDGGTEVVEFVDLTAAVFALFVPLVSIALGYKSVIDERESGSIVLALSFPHTRRDLVTGKFVGRTLVLAIPMLVGMIVASTLVIWLYDTLPVGRYLLFAGLNVLYGMAFLGIAFGLSMSTTSSRRVTAGAFGAYVVLVMLWAELIDLLVLVLWRFDASVLLDGPDWALFTRLLSPEESYERLITALFDSDTGAAYVGTDVPWFVDSWVAVLVLAGWVVVPIAVGYLRFDRSDL